MCETFSCLEPDSLYPPAHHLQFNEPWGIAVRANLPFNGSVVAEAVYVVSEQAWGDEGHIAVRARCPAAVATPPTRVPA